MDRVERALALVTRLTAATTAAQTIDVFQEAIEPFGVRLYRAVVMGNSARMADELIVASNWPQEWQDFYTGKKAFNFDPVAWAALKSDGFYWRDVPESTNPEGRKLMADAREFGLNDGFTAVRTVHGASKTALSLAGDNLDWSPIEEGVVTLLSNSLMSRVLYLRDVQIAPAVQVLTRREVEILSFAAAGYRDKEIAIALKLSHETIRFYWKTIRRKLGAKDRANAVAVAMWSRQVLP